MPYRPPVDRQTIRDKAEVTGGAITHPSCPYTSCLEIPHVRNVTPPDSFTGTGTQSWHGWRKEFERYLEFARINVEDFTAVIQLSGCLKGAAKTTYNNLSHETQRCAPDALRALESHYGGETERQQGRDLLAKVRLTSEDTGATYTHKFLDAYMRAYPHGRMDQDTPNYQAVADFLRCLHRPAAADSITCLAPTTIREAARYLNGWLDSQRDKLHRAQTEAEAPGRGPDSSLDPMFRVHLPNRVTAVPTNNVPTQGNKQTPQTNYSRPQHQESQQQSAQQRDNNQQKRRQSNGISPDKKAQHARVQEWLYKYDLPFYPSKGICWCCGELMHPLLECPLLEAAERRRSAQRARAKAQQGQSQPSTPNNDTAHLNA